MGLPGRENASKCTDALCISEVFVNLDLASWGFEVAQEWAGNLQDSFQEQSDSCTSTTLIEPGLWHLSKTVVYVHILIAKVMMFLRIREHWNAQNPTDTKSAPYLQLAV